MFLIAWFLYTYYLYQIRQTKCILLLSTVATPAPLFSKFYMDTIFISIFHDIICCWCSLIEIVTDNDNVFLKAVAHLSKKYYINHNHILGYNFPANGLVECSYFDIREVLFKAADSEQSKWSTVCHSIFWADHISICQKMGCFPYFAVTGTHLLLPLHIAEATYLLPPLESVLSTTDHIAYCAIALQKHQIHLEQLHSDCFCSLSQECLSI
ncbi:hypothetical protein BDQ12DRAFT_604746 [Crucibulum laeve]|uniref:Integrase catalytic domain-containing protein n=1 Tax=Crucibulum laeve TaxID=68775 RepID=A0A5C3M1X3_9AGAR|nr:hypothetical protein BDQ12DRAFT_604746 [Crucibulum laeve]